MLSPRPNNTLNNKDYYISYNHRDDTTAVVLNRQQDDYFFIVNGDHRNNMKDLDFWGSLQYLGKQEHSDTSEWKYVGQGMLGDKQLTEEEIKLIKSFQ